jgi:hypothetical protein
MLDVSVGSLTAKILCKRHNEALSPLDEEAGHFFSSLRNALIDLQRKTLSRRPIFHLIGGEALELWMLKVACGLYFSIGAKDGVKIAQTHSINLNKVAKAFFENSWDARAGLYFQAATGSAINIADTVAISPLTRDHEAVFGGAVVSLHGFALEILVDDEGTNPGPWTSLVRRPTELILERHRREHHIVLTWPPGTPEASVRMQERR